MKQEWRIFAKTADFNAISSRFGIDPVVARIIRNRDIVTDEEYESYLFGTLDSVHDPSLMMDMELGADIIAGSIEAGENIRIVGDYDVDGVMSTYILYDALKNAGANVSFDIPHRVNDGYGINTRIIEKAYEESVSTIITCDNGIAAVNAMKKARELGLNIVITDHHEIQEELPDADAIIDPHQAGDTYPYADICGALVAYKFIKVLYQTMDIPLESRKYLEMVALATVCDVMPLINENRIYVREGLRALEKTENIGLKALLKETNYQGKTIDTYHAGFIIGPCINAAGRLESADVALSLLLEEDEEKASEIAAHLKELNESRKSMTEQGTASAIQLIEKETGFDSEGMPKQDVLVVYVPDLHESLAGIVAGRLKEKYYRPTIVFTDTDKDDDIVKGSGRSIEAYNMFEQISACKDILLKFGGHPLAAGMSLKKSDLDEFRKRLNSSVSLSERDKTPKLMIDVPMPMSYATLKLAEQLADLGPFGKGNEPPLFAEKDMEILGARVMGQNKNVLKLKVRSSRGDIHEVTSFRPDDFIECINEWFTEQECDRIMKGVRTGCKLDIAYEVTINDYYGRNVQFMLKAFDKS